MKRIIKRGEPRKSNLALIASQVVLMFIFLLAVRCFLWPCDSTSTPRVHKQLQIPLSANETRLNAETVTVVEGKDAKYSNEEALPTVFPTTAFQAPSTSLHDGPLLRPISWAAAIKYTPVSNEAISGFMVQEEKQRARPAALLSSWRKWDSKSICSTEVPECDFFLHIPNAQLLRHKCCAEHQKLKRAFFYTMDVVEAYNRWAEGTRLREPIQLFLDSGALLSSVRDGGDTLIPWETDIDLGIVGGMPDNFMDAFGDGLEGGSGGTFTQKVKGEWAGLHYNARSALLPKHFPNTFAKVFESWTGQQGSKAGAAGELLQTYKKEWNIEAFNLSESSLRPPHYFEPCITKKSVNQSVNGLCKDAHYIFYVKTSFETLTDTSRVEIYPFVMRSNASSSRAPYLEHPTRKRLNVPVDWVLPLDHSCRLWGRLVPCPHHSGKYLDQEYGQGTWMRPQTIHWGEKNIKPWK